VSAPWWWAAGIVAGASFVMGLAGFGIGLVALAFLPFVMAPATAVVLMTVYALASALVILVPLRRDIAVPRLVDLLIGTVAGVPLGVWVIATLSPGALRRLIGLVLVAIVLLEVLGRLPSWLPDRRWGVLAGFLAGLMGAAAGAPGPAVVVYATTQEWSPRTIKANLQAFFVVNETVVLVGYWWAGLVTLEVGRAAVAFALPALAGVVLGVGVSNRIDRARFRRIVFAVLFVSGVVLLLRG
jgi:uncharacterized membrane protein YfcA